MPKFKNVRNRLWININMPTINQTHFFKDGNKNKNSCSIRTDRMMDHLPSWKLWYFKIEHKYGFFSLNRLIPCSCTHTSLNNDCAQCIDLDICCLTHGCLPLKRHTFVLTKKNENRHKKRNSRNVHHHTHTHACMHT